MIPYLNFERPFQLLHLPIQMFGLLLVCAVWLGSTWTQRRARQLGLAREKTSAMFLYAIITAFVLAHVFDLVAYQWPGGRPPLLVILNPFAGLSSYGGFAGAVLGGVLWCWRSNEPPLPYADAASFGLAPGWLLGRIGCFTVHDHPGRLTDFPLAVRYPDGARHDSGLYEAVLALGLTVLFWMLQRRPRPTGLYAALFCLIYGPPRFFLDFLRATDVRGADPRYFGLTPAQYASIAVFGVGLALLRLVRRKNQQPAVSPIT